MLRECIRGDFRDDLGQDADSEPGGAGVGLLGVGEVKGAARGLGPLWSLEPRRGSRGGGGRL